MSVDGQRLKKVPDTLSLIAARAPDSGDRVGQLRMFIFLDQRHACHELPQKFELMSEPVALQSARRFSKRMEKFGLSMKTLVRSVCLLSSATKFNSGLPFVA